MRRNRRVPRKERRKRRAARFAVWRGEVFENRIAKGCLIALLVVLCWVTGRAFLSGFQVAAAAEFWKNETAWFFIVGMALWFAVFHWGHFRPTVLYVFGHEATHFLFVRLHGGEVDEFKVSSDGGYVIADRNNTLISLSPYFIPFWSLVVLFAYWVLSWFVDTSVIHVGAIYGLYDFSWLRLLYLLLGATWGFHLSYTVLMARDDQPDLQENGFWFSVFFILFMNLLLLSGMLVLASPNISWQDFISSWWSEIIFLYEFLYALLKNSLS